MPDLRLDELDDAREQPITPTSQAPRPREGAGHTAAASPACQRLAMTSNSLAVNVMPGARMVVYTPADETTRAAVAGLIAWDGAGARFPCWAVHPQPGQQATRGAMEAAGQG